MPRRAVRLALFTLCAVAFLTFLDTTIVSVALASVQTTIHAGVTQLQWVVNGYALAFASLMLAAGNLGDRIGRRKVMLSGLIVFCAGSLLAALAPNANVLIAGRVVMGIGAAASEPGTLSVIRHLYPAPAQRARALGAWAAVSGLALAAGPVIGGVLVGLGSFRTVFYFNLAAGVVLVALGARYIPESSDPSPARFDVPGFLLGALCVASLTVAVIVGESDGYVAPHVLALFVTGGITFVGFVLAERRAASPILDLGFMRLPAFSGALSVAFALFFGIFSIFFFTALYLQVVVNYSGYRTAVEFLPMAATLIGSSLVAGRLVVRFGPRLPMTGGAALAGLGVLSSDAVLNASSTPSLWLMATLAVAGLGFGLGVVPVTSVALGVVPSEHSGMAASATNTARELGAVFGVAVLGALVNANLTSQLLGKLHALGIPSGFQAIVLGAVETGNLPAGGSDSAAAKAYGEIVNKVIHAAYGAFRSGLDVSLVVSGITMLVAALIAATTLSGRHNPTP